MVKVDFKNYSDYINYAEQCKSGNVYPLSIAEGYQQGDVFVIYHNPDKKILEKLRNNKTRTELWDDLPTELEYNSFGKEIY